MKNKILNICLNIVIILAFSLLIFNLLYPYKDFSASIDTINDIDNTDKITGEICTDTTKSQTEEKANINTEIAMNAWQIYNELFDVFVEDEYISLLSKAKDKDYILEKWSEMDQYEIEKLNAISKRIEVLKATCLKDELCSKDTEMQNYLSSLLETAEIERSYYLLNDYNYVLSAQVKMASFDSFSEYIYKNRAFDALSAKQKNQFFMLSNSDLKNLLKFKDMFLDCMDVKEDLQILSKYSDFCLMDKATYETKVEAVFQEDYLEDSRICEFEKLIKDSDNCKHSENYLNYIKNKLSK